MSPFPQTDNNPIATIKLYDLVKERDLIELEDEPPQQHTVKPLMEVNIKFEDLIGDQQVSFVKNEQNQGTKIQKADNVMQYMEVMDYIDKCNQTHAMLMQQVAETRLRCRKLFYEFM